MRTSHLILAAVAALCLSADASAHGSAAWIMGDEKLYDCCGPRDCDVVQVYSGEDAYTFAWHGFVYTVPFNSPEIRKTLNPNAQDKFWGCVDPDTGTLKCLIVPQTGY